MEAQRSHVKAVEYRGRADTRYRAFVAFNSGFFCCIMSDLVQIFIPASLWKGFLELPRRKEREVGLWLEFMGHTG